MRRRENLVGFLFLLPWVLGFFAFFLYPLLYSLTLAFGKITNLTSFDVEWDGLANFQNVFFSDTKFLGLFVDTILEALPNMILVVTFSLFIAILLNRKIRFRGLFRVAFLLPIIIGTGAVMSALQGNNSFGGAAIADAGGLGANTGTAAESLTSFKDLVITEQLVLFLGEDLAGILTVIFNRLSSVMWLSGIQIIIFMGALQTIPNTLYEAAYCDGATEWEKFWKITLPLTMPNIALNMVYTIVDYSSNIDNSVVEYITEKMGQNLFTYASAMAWTYFALIGIIIGLIMMLMRRRTFYMG